MNAELLLKFAALAHIGLAAAGLLMPRVTELWAQLERVSPFARGVFRTYYAFIGLCLVGFGLGSWFLAGELSSGAPLARAVCGFLAVFWLLRIVATIWLLDVRVYLTRMSRRLGYHTLNATFCVLPLIYGWIALRP